MALDNVANFAIATTSGGYDSSATSITLLAGEGAKFPTAPFNLVWWNITDFPNPADDPDVEIVRCTNVAGDVLAVTRAQEGTAATNKNTSSKTYKMLLSITKKMINDIEAVHRAKGHFSNLIIVPNSTNSYYQIDINADSVVLANATNVLYEALGVDLTVDLSTSGANGLDTGTAAAGTWYFLWVIYDGTTVASLASLSSSAPTMPGSYTYKKLVGAVRNIGMVSQLHMDGADEGITFTDQSGKVWTANGNANTEATDPKFGTASAEFDGTGDWIDTPDHADFTLGTKDFTIEFWIKRGRAATLEHIAGQSTSGLTPAWYIQVQADNTLRGEIYSGGDTFCSIAGFSDTTSWHHIAFVRKGNLIRIFLDGTGGTPVTADVTVSDSSAKIGIGRAGEYASNIFQGKIDEFSITVGLAKYWDNFTPPTAALVNLVQILPFTQIDRGVQLSYPHKVANDTGTTTTASISLATVIPSIVKKVWGKVMANTGALSWFLHSKTFPDTLAVDNNFAASQVYIAGAASAVQWFLELLEETQTVYHQVSANTVDIWVSGFDLKI